MQNSICEEDFSTLTQDNLITPSIKFLKLRSRHKNTSYSRKQNNNINTLQLSSRKQKNMSLLDKQHISSNKYSKRRRKSMQTKLSNMLIFAVSVIFMAFSKQNFVLSQNSDDTPGLFCQPNKMWVSISKSYLRKHNIELKSSSQLFFRGHQSCFAEEGEDEYILTVHSPFQACGTSLEHTSEDYIYTNEVVLDRRDGHGATKLLEMRCVYEDKYIVSSGPIKPTKNTLTFTTEYGEFETKMALYNNAKFDSLAKLDDRPMVQLSQKVYVSVSMFIPFNPEYNNDFTITIKSCFANTDENHTNMEMYHYLISGMCASPDDETVAIYQNGRDSSTEARFSFNMFKFRKGFDYIYLHCEVKLCNSTAEVCNGSGNKQCNGADEASGEQTIRRRRRDLTNLSGSKSRSTREIDGFNDIPDPEDDSLAILSRGPLILEEVSKEAIDAKSKITISINDFKTEQSILRLWVFSGIAVTIGIIGIILTGVTIFKRRQERLKLQQHGTVITAPTLAANKTTTWRQGPLPTPPAGDKKDNDG